MTRAQFLEMLELVAKRGHRDGYDDQPAISRLKIARQFIGPVYGKKDADCMGAVYRMGFNVGEEEAAKDKSA